MPIKEPDEQTVPPSFRYCPDPITAGTVISDSDTPCLGCNRIRGWVYIGPYYTEKNFILDHHLCPWCIADGTAARRFGATFNDAGMMKGVTPATIEEIEQRTPGFVAWQGNHWLACCKDAAAFLGVVGAAELRRDFPDAAQVVRKYLRDEYDLSGDDLQDFFDSLSKDDQPTAYLFRCLHCKDYLAYVDET